MQFTRSLSQLDHNDVMLAGGKGASLGEMLYAGIPVPGGFVVLSTTFDYFIQKTGLTVQIDTILAHVDHKTISSVESASERIQALILEFPMPDEIEQEIYESYVTENLERVAVRSSATAEDGAEHARAGQLDSYLNTKKSDLIEKIRHCRASLFTPRAIFYRFEKELHKDHISVAVVVQKMVQSEISGIAFSVHPVTEDRNQMIIEAGFGLGEAIVSGSVTPDSYVVRKDNNHIDITVNQQQKALYKAAGGGNEWAQLGDKGNNQILTKEQILELSKIILRIENHYGFPCDIERAYEGGTFYIVQSRPITTLQSEDNTLDELNIQTDLWSLKSTEGYMHLCYPFVLGFELFPKVKPLKNHHTSFVAVENEMIYVYENFSILSSIRDEFLEKSFHDSLYYNQFKKMYYEYVKDFEKEIQTLNQKDITLLSDDELIDSYDSFFKIYLKQFAHVCAISEAITQTSSLYIDPHFKKVMGDGFDKDFHILTHPSTFSFLEEEKQERELLLQEYLEKQFIDEVKLNTHANEYFYIKSNYKYGHNLTAHDFMEMIIEQSNNSGNTEKQKMQLIEKDIIFQRYEFSLYDKFLLQIVDDFFKIVDDRKKNMMKASYYQINFLKELEKRTGLQFRLLTYTLQTEYKDILRGQYDLGELQQRAKGLFVINDNALKPIFITGEKYKLTKQALDDSINRVLCGDGKSIVGTKASQGKVTGIVKILLNYEDIGSVQKGNIIVSSMTRPEMMPAMEKAAAFVTDEGGITCHASIVAREMNKPCIIGTKFATQVFKDGDIVEVDADNGIVRILENKKDIPEFIHHVYLIGSRPSNIQRDECLGLFMYQHNNTEFVTIPLDHTNRGYYYEKEKFHTYLEEWKNTLLTKEGYRDYLLGYEELKEYVSQFVVQDGLSKDDIQQKFNERYKLVSSMTPYIMCSVGTEDFLDPLCRDLLQQYCPDKLDDIFDALSNPTELTEYQMMMKKIYEIKLGLHQYSLSQLVNDYYRYPEYRFTEDLYTELYFQNILDNLTLEDAQHEYDELIVLLSKNKKRFVEVVASLQDYPDIQHLLEVINTNIWLRTDRVDTFKKGQPQVRKLYSQIVSFLHQEGQLNYNYDDVLWMTNNEIYNYLNHNDIISYDIIQQRKTNECVMIYDGKRIYVDLDKENIKNIKNIILGEDTSEIKGMISYPGNVQGRVQIVRSREDLSLVMEGDILVAKTTFVEYTPAMKVAGAIVTDEGGITSHAAIVSRELKKPCVVGCKKAVDVLHTGDIVEVDAYNGIVKILNHDINEHQNISINIDKEFLRRRVEGFPALIGAACEGFVTKAYEEFGCEWPRSDIIFVDDICYRYTNRDDIYVAGEKMSDFFWDKDRNDFKKSYKILYDTRKNNLLQINTYIQENLTQDNFDELWEKFFVYYRLFWSISMAPEVISYTYGNYLEQELKSLFGEIGTNVLFKITQFSQMSFHAQEELDLLKITQDKTQNGLYKHYEKYKRILDGYHGKGNISLDYFKNRINEYNKNADMIGEKIMNIQNHYHVTENLFYETVKQYNLTNDIVAMAQKARIGAYYQDDRKKISLIVIDSILKLYTLKAQQLSLSLDMMMRYMPSELVEGNTTLGLGRYKEDVRFMTGNGKITVIIQDVTHVLQMLNNQYTGDQNGQEVKGLTANGGKVQGKVCLIHNTREIHNFPEGAILVAMMTSPDYVVAMRKAKAVITDDGGITCHAAIVSRELGMPCIVGTRIATQILKDGDLVEVDADNGVVRILSS